MNKEAVGVTIKSLYDKLANTELAVSHALVRDTALQLMPIVRFLGAELPPLLEGYRAKILDGKHLGGTEHRRKERNRRGFRAKDGNRRSRQRRDDDDSSDHHRTQ